jgi:hypothetical protein
MFAIRSLKQSMARNTDAVLHLMQHSLMIVGLALVFSFLYITTNVRGAHKSASADASDTLTQDSPTLDSPTLASPSLFTAAPESVSVEPAAFVLTPRMQGALDYVKRRYRVSPDAVTPVFEVAQRIGLERRIDPLLIVAIIGIESGFNPFAESPMGAQGLMQIIPRFHQDKLPEGTGDQALLDPAINIRVGVGVLEEAIRRRGSLIGGLQYYAGSSDPEGFYATKVLAEKERLEQASRRNAAPAPAPALTLALAPNA